MGISKPVVESFRAMQEQREMDARQRVALQLACGLDLDAALGLARENRGQVVERVDRALRCERLKGLRRHWSYDLNRHIALKQVLDRLRGDKDARKENGQRMPRRPSKFCPKSP